MAIASYTALVAALAKRSTHTYDKAQSGGTTSENYPKSMWRVDDLAPDNIWPTAVAPVSEALSKSTVGALPFPAPGAGNTLYLAGVRVAALGSLSESPNGLVLADRLTQVGGLVGNVATAQTVNTPALPRHTSGEGVHAFVEINTAIGTTATSATVSYTNQAGTAGRTGTIPIIGGNAANDATTMLRISPEGGDTGFRSVESITLAATTGTAGNLAVVLVKPITIIWRREFYYNAWDWLDIGLPAIDPDSCLFFYTTPWADNRATHVFSFDWIEG